MLTPVNGWHVAHPAGDAVGEDVVVAGTIEKNCLHEGMG